MQRKPVFLALLIAASFFHNTIALGQGIGSKVSLDGKLDPGPFKLRTVEDLDYLDGGTAVGVGPGTVPGYPNKMWADFGANYLISKDGTQTLFRDCGNDYKTCHAPNSQTLKWSAFYQELAFAIGHAWKSKAKGEILVIIQIDKDGLITVKKTLEPHSKKTAPKQCRIQ